MQDVAMLIFRICRIKHISAKRRKSRQGIMVLCSRHPQRFILGLGSFYFEVDQGSFTMVSEFQNPTRMPGRVNV